MPLPPGIARETAKQLVRIMRVSCLDRIAELITDAPPLIAQELRPNTRSGFYESVRVFRSPAREARPSPKGSMLPRTAPFGNARG